MPLPTRHLKELNTFTKLVISWGGSQAVRGLKRGKAVSAGELLARHPSPDKGDLSAAAAGFIEEVNEWGIVLKCDPGAIGETPQPRPLKSLEGISLAQTLKELGFSFPLLDLKIAPIISLLSPEPGLDYHGTLLAEHKETLGAGLNLLGQLYSDRQMVLVGGLVNPFPQVPLVNISPAYPWALPELIRQKIDGKNSWPKSEKLQNHGVFTLRDLFFLGRTARTGLPQTKTILTLGQADYLAPIGAPLIELLRFANLAPGPGEAVVAGGLVRGLTLARLEQGLTWETEALHLRKKIPIEPKIRPCYDCKECQSHCPLELPVARLAALEPDLWLRHGALDSLKECLACGLCALVCPAKRPLLSLARLAQRK